MDFRIFNAARERSWSDFEDAPEQEILRACLTWLQSWTEENFVDWELIEDAGELLGRGSIGAMEQAVLGWAGADYAPRRGEIASSFLRGYWRQQPIGRGAVREMVLYLDRGPPSGEARASIALTLADLMRTRRAALDAETLRLIRSTLERLLVSFESEPRWQGLSAAIKTALAALEKAGRAAPIDRPK